MLNTMSPAYNKIFGAKFLSFERLETIYSYTVGYAPSVFLWLEKNKRKIPSKKAAPILREQDAAY